MYALVMQGLSSPYQLGGSNGSGGCSKQQQHEASVSTTTHSNLLKLLTKLVTDF